MYIDTSLQYLCVKEPWNVTIELNVTFSNLIPNKNVPGRAPGAGAAGVDPVAGAELGDVGLAAEAGAAAGAPTLWMAAAMTTAVAPSLVPQPSSATAAFSVFSS